MRIRTLVAVIVAVAFLPVPAFAGDRGDRDSRREKLLRRFDENGDGKLDRKEREKLRRFLRDKHKNRDRGDDAK